MGVWISTDDLIDLSVELDCASLLKTVIRAEPCHVVDLARS